MEQRSVEVGVGVLVWKGKQIALIKRAKAYGKGTWSPPGGHVEFRESVFETAHRETMEEIGVEIKNIKILGFVEDLTEDLHYITVWVCADWASGELKGSDTEFTESGYFFIDKLPDPLFFAFQNLLNGKLKPKSINISHLRRQNKSL